MRYDTPVAITTRARDFCPVGELHDPQVAVDAQTRGGVAVDHLGPEQDGLVERARRQLGAADAAWKSEVVPDHRARSGLTTHRSRFDERRTQSLRLGVHGGRESGRPAADDDEVVDPRARASTRTQRIGDLRVGRIDERTTVSQNDNRTHAGLDPREFQDRRRRTSESAAWNANGMSCRCRRSHISYTRAVRSAPTMRTAAERGPEHAPPLVQELGDAAMKSLVGRTGGLGDEAFGPSPSERVRDLLAMAPALVPVQQQTPPRVRVQCAGIVEQARLRSTARSASIRATALPVSASARMRSHAVTPSGSTAIV